MRDLQKTHRWTHEPLPSDPDAVTALEQNHADSMEIFKASVVNGSATVTTAELCLTKLSSFYDTLDKKDTNAILRSTRSGAYTLNWLWQASPRHAHDFMNSTSAMVLLCDFLVREGNEDLIVQWLQVEAEVFDSQPSIAVRWRAFLFANLVRAKLGLVFKTGPGTGDHAIKCVLDAHTLKTSSDFEPFRTMSLWPAILLLQMKLVQPNFSNTDPTLWDRLISVTESLRPWRFRYGDPVMRLKLFHPSSPVVEPFLEAISGISQETEFAGNERAQLALQKDMQHALAILKRKGRGNEAERILSTAKKHLSNRGYKEVERTCKSDVPISRDFMR